MGMFKQRGDSTFRNPAGLRFGIVTHLNCHVKTFSRTEKRGNRSMTIGKWTRIIIPQRIS
ncbi:MAG: hypothetical protein A2Z06_03090 [Candidatus Glassbacteria bacterium RBG_16_58_8]|uniref:Uncharacterized protein n=1 Tax=Candidatus Glassbacteria bacterium RBG_16_58_8 TaxID=1817866 RepID=A0A1F5YCZ7_9BACT|nr:MAG: hypothetical protein A2Z06_03090 [Candidatus Glassbacteria bacterium RBG_16_58_8]